MTLRNVSRLCKSVWRRRHLVTRFLEHSRPLDSRRGARKPWTSIRTERPTIPDQESQGHAARPRTTRFHNQRGVRARARGPGRGQGTSAPTDWFRSQGNGEWALETRLAELPCRDNSQGYAKVGEEAREKRIEDSRCESADSSGGIAIGAPGRNFSLCCGCGNLDRLPLRRGSASIGQSLGLQNRDRESPCRMRGRSTWTWAMNPQACMGRRTCPWRNRANRHPCQRGDRPSRRIPRVLELGHRGRGLRLELGHRDQAQGRQLHHEFRRGLRQP